MIALNKATWLRVNDIAVWERSGEVDRPFYPVCRPCCRHHSDEATTTRRLCGNPREEKSVEADHVCVLGILSLTRRRPPRLFQGADKTSQATPPSKAKHRSAKHNQTSPAISYYLTIFAHHSSLQNSRHTSLSVQFSDTSRHRTLLHHLGLASPSRWSDRHAIDPK